MSKYKISNKNLLNIRNRTLPAGRQELVSRNSRRGFTLIELIMSMGIMALLIGVFTGIFGSIVDTSLDSNATSGVDQDGRFIIARLGYDMQRATQIVTPATPGSITSNTLTIKINSIDYTYSLDGSGNVQLTDNIGSNSLNSNTTQVSNLTFQRLGIGDTTDTVQVKFTLTSRIKESKGQETKSFQTTIGIQ